MFNFIRQLRPFLTHAKPSSLILLFFVMIGGAALEVVGVGIVLPFIALLNNQSLITDNVYFRRLYEVISPQNFNEFLLYSIILLIGFFILKNTFLYGSVVLQSQFLKKLHKSFAVRLFESYLLCPYSMSLRRNSAQQIRNLTIVGSIVQGLIFPILVLITESFVAVSVFVYVIWTHPGPSIFVAVSLILSVSIFYLLVRRRLILVGTKLNDHYSKMMQILQQGLGSAKETRIMGRQHFFSKNFEAEVEEVLEASRLQNQLSQLPRYYIESIIVSLILMCMGWYIVRGRSTSEIIASVSIFAVAALRLMPGFARISGATNSIRFYSPGLNEVYEDLIECETASSSPEVLNQVESFQFQHEISVEKLEFTYENADRPSISGLDLNIKKNSMVGLIGPSGSGKTTLIDLILGLLVPQAGIIRVDGRNIQSNLRGWQQLIGYIPQQIYLTDDSIKKNIAFGLDSNTIDHEKVWKALKLAQLDDFVQELPLGIETIVGERGARLSGGQRQRIGIARALYHDPQILIFDEATAALDIETERLLIEAIRGLVGKRTMIFIAHRVTTLNICDLIYFLQDGKLVGQGSYDDLLRKLDLDRNASLKGAGIFELR